MIGFESSGRSRKAKELRTEAEPEMKEKPQSKQNVKKQREKVKKEFVVKWGLVVMVLSERNAAEVRPEVK